MRTFEDVYMDPDMSDTDRLEALRRMAQTDPDFDYCVFQDMVNAVGGDQYSPAFQEDLQVPSERLKPYGFKYWMSHATFSIVTDEWQYPTFSGVYAVVAIHPGSMVTGMTVGAQHVLYIGCAKNIAARIGHRDHWYQRAMVLEERCDCVVQLFVLPTTDYRLYERSLIRTLRPLFNVHHRNG